MKLILLCVSALFLVVAMIHGAESSKALFCLGTAIITYLMYAHQDIMDKLKEFDRKE